MDALPDDISLKFLEIGVKNSTLTFSDICRISVCSKNLNKLCNEDSLWSMLLARDFPEYEKEVVTYSKKTHYMFCLVRLIKSRIGYLHRKLDKYEDRAEHLDKLIDRQHEGLIGDPNENICGQLLDMAKERNFLLPGILDETARAKFEEATTKSLQWEAWYAWAEGVISVSAQMTPLASHTPTSTPYLIRAVGSSSFDSSSFLALVDDMKKKLSSFRAREPLYSSILENKREHGIFHYQIKKLHAQIAALDHRKALLSAYIDFEEGYDDDDYDYSNAEYDTEDDDDSAVSSDDEGFDYETEDDDCNAVSFR